MLKTFVYDSTQEVLNQISDLTLVHIRGTIISSPDNEIIIRV